MGKGMSGKGILDHFIPLPFIPLPPFRSIDNSVPGLVYGRRPAGSDAG
jgi:hypothetical protein